MKKAKEKAIRDLLKSALVSIVVGAVVGAVIFAYKWGAEILVDWSVSIYGAVAENLLFLPLLLLGLAALALVMYALTRAVPMAAGGGTPIAEGLMRGLVGFRWLRTLLAMILNSYLSFFAGLPLDNEGPSVLIGTALGKGGNTLMSRKRGYDRFAMTGGAAAGFAVAAGGPLTGVAFVLEEVHRRFSPTLLLYAMCSVASGCMVNEALCIAFSRSSRLFHFGVLSAVPLRDLWLAPIVGLLTGLLAAGFSKGYVTLRSGLSTKKLPFWAKLVIVFLMMGVVGVFIPSAIGSGHALIDTVTERQLMWWVLLVLLVVKCVTVVAVGGIGASGGICIPILTIGALCGALIGEGASAIISDEVYSLVVIASIASFMSAVIRAPITSVMFAFEVLGGAQNPIFILVTILVSYLVGGVLGSKPLYDDILERKIEGYYDGKTAEFREMTLEVKPDSLIVGKATRDILWPPSCLVLEIRRAHLDSEDKDRNGDKTLRPGDVLKLSVRTYDEAETRLRLEEILGTQQTAL